MNDSKNSGKVFLATVIHTNFLLPLYTKPPELTSQGEDQIKQRFN